MKKTKAIASLLCVLALLCTPWCLTAFAASPSVEFHLPKTIKIGHVLDYSKEYIQIKNFNPENEYGCMDVQEQLFAHFTSKHRGTGGIDPQGKDYITESFLCAKTPGTVTFQAHSWEYDRETETGVKTPIGNPFKMRIEEPVITTNCPATVEAGKTISLTTALTNTELKNHAISEFDAIKTSEDHPYSDFLHETIFYQPSIEIIKGKNLVERSKANYSNTLKSSETWKFKQSGTVQFKIKYSVLVPNFGEEKDTLCYSSTYNPEKVVTVKIVKKSTPSSSSKPASNSTPKIPSTSGNESPSSKTSSSDTSTVSSTSDSSSTATEPMNPSSTDQSQANEPLSSVNSDTAFTSFLSDKETGISIIGEFPSGSSVKASAIADGDIYKKAEQELSGNVEKFAVFDISMRDGSDNTIQPNGDVQVSIPKPERFSDALAVYRVEEDKSLTLISSELKNGQIIFTTDKLSFYAIADLSSSNSFPIWAIVAIAAGTLVVIGSGTAGILLLRKKKARSFKR